ncbi:MAG TPA: MerR family transcriptional regulator [Solirubrobacteraceae bacterium]
MRTVGEVSEFAGVSVRTLHHYDEVGLLSPSGRSHAGYRLYSHADLERLQEILVWKHLGLALAQIRAVLDEGPHDRVSTLRHQRELVGREAERLGGVARALDRAIAAEERGIRLKEETMFEGFDHGEYAAEARARWRHTDSYRESARRAAAYGEEDWHAIRAEAQEIVGEFADLVRMGEIASGERAQAVAERHRQHISRWFYPCPPAMHRALGEMYVADPRFAANYDKVSDGLAAYVCDAIAANAAAP